MKKHSLYLCLLTVTVLVGISFLPDFAWGQRARGPRIPDTPRLRLVRNSLGGGDFCLEADWHRMRENGGIVQLWECHGGVQQQWVLNHKEDNFFTIENGGNLCLDADVNNWRQSGAIVQVWECNNSRQQTWELFRRGSENGQYRFALINGGGLCLDLDANRPNENGAIVQLWQCNYDPQQLWLFY